VCRPDALFDALGACEVLALGGEGVVVGTCANQATAVTTSSRRLGPAERRHGEHDEQAEVVAHYFTLFYKFIPVTVCGFS